MKLKSFKPDQDFKERTKRLFLAAYRDQFPGIDPAVSFGFRFRYFVRGAGAGVAVMLILSGAAVYADQKDVGPENVLYSLKRSSEYVNLAFTSDAEKPTAHLSLANRRLKEIESLEEKNPESPKVAILKNDLELEITNSFKSVNFEDSVKDDVPQPLLTKEVEDKNIQTPVEAPRATQPSNNQDDKKEATSAKMQVRGFSAPTAPVQAITPETDLLKNLTKNEKEFCESWSSLLDSKEKTIFETTKKYKEVWEKIKKQCRSEFKSKNFQSELEVETEIETEIELEKEINKSPNDSKGIEDQKDDQSGGNEQERD